MRRRSFLGSLGLLIGSPAIVRASSLMSVVPVSPIGFEVIRPTGRFIVSIEEGENGEFLSFKIGDIVWDHAPPLHSAGRVLSDDYAALGNSRERQLTSNISRRFLLGRSAEMPLPQPELVEQDISKTKNASVPNTENSP